MNYSEIEKVAQELLQGGKDHQEVVVDKKSEENIGAIIINGVQTEIFKNERKNEVEEEDEKIEVAEEEPK